MAVKRKKLVNYYRKQSGKQELFWSPKGMKNKLGNKSVRVKKLSSPRPCDYYKDATIRIGSF